MKGVVFRVPRIGVTLIAAKRYGVSEKTVRRYVAQGLITGYRVGQKRLIRVDLAECDARLLTTIPTIQAG